HLDRVNLDITGHRSGGTLGVLFCRLARGASAPKTARALNASINRRQKALRFTVRLKPAQAPAKSGTTAGAAQTTTPTCQVLDLVVGPLNLDLLGLVVDLKRVHLSVTATRGQGKLGDLFCQFADQS